jgi:hypothetical protein
MGLDPVPLGIRELAELEQRYQLAAGAHLHSRRRITGLEQPRTPAHCARAESPGIQRREPRRCRRFGWRERASRLEPVVRGQVPERWRARTLRRLPRELRWLRTRARASVTGDCGGGCGTTYRTTKLPGGLRFAVSRGSVPPWLSRFQGNGTRLCCCL